MLQNINPYNKEEFEKYFKATPMYQEVLKDFDYVSFYTHFHDVINLRKTPREWYGEGLIRKKGLLSAIPFFLLKFITDANTKEIYDLGCGWNIFKRYVPNIIGVDYINPDEPYYYADIHANLDAEYIANHQNAFEGVIAINTFTFGNMSDLRQTVTDFVSMLKPDGIGAITFNTPRLLEFEKNFQPNHNIVELDQYVRTVLDNVDWKYLSVDIDIRPEGDYMDGDIRLVIQK